MGNEEFLVRLNSLLKTLGLPPAENESRAVDRVNVWLGNTTQSSQGFVHDDDFQATELTVEDCLPLSDQLLEETARLLYFVWNDGSNLEDDLQDTTQVSQLLQPLPRNLLKQYHNPLLFVLESDNISNESISLQQVFPSVRVTEWICWWMEYDLSTSCYDDEEECQKEKSYSNILQNLLLRRQSHKVDSNSQQMDNWISPRKLLASLLTHIQDLPVLEHHVQQYCQALQLTHRHTGKASAPISSLPISNTVTNRGLSSLDTASLLHHYQNAQTMQARIQEEFRQHVNRLEIVLRESYRQATVPLRVILRQGLGRLWSNFVLDTSSSSPAATTGTVSLREVNTRAAPIHMTLTVLHSILLGIASPTEQLSRESGTESWLADSYKALLFQHLIPLHHADGLVLWRDQIPILQLYHEPLVKCTAVLIRLDSRPDQPHLNHQSLLSATLHALVEPRLLGSAPSGKQVLLLHEIDTLIGLWQPHSAGTENHTQEGSASVSWFLDLLPVLGKCMSSDHSRVAERALQLFTNDKFVLLAQSVWFPALKIVLPALVPTRGNGGGDEPSWNPTVRKMTYTVLRKIQHLDAQRGEPCLERVSNQVLSPTPPIRQFGPPTESAVLFSTTTTPRPQGISLVSNSNKVGLSGVPSNNSLQAGMGTWRPPSSTTNFSSSSSMPAPTNRKSTQPPLTVTGVAPWAVSTQPQRVISSSVKGNTRKLPPPLTVTGVAPWAVPRRAPSPAPTHKQRRVDKSSHPSVNVKSGTTEDERPPSPTLESSATGYKRLLRYMELLKPPREQEGHSSWSKSQMAETPTLLPHLKFHDLVFGHELGAGAFGVVKYARLIDKTTTRSQWPEYAVKIISTDKIRDLGYEASVQREIAVLRILGHPGIARLVSSFRFREGAYLVLEYASNGDLHSLLHKHGSLDNDSTRFVVGEIVAALASIHELGFVYGDLKPENIVVTESGHVKLADFGACRPFSREATELITMSAKGVLSGLRDGDWKATASDTNDRASDPEESDTGDEDLRIEGTAAYLPPEVVMGAVPNIGADSWALGCVTYQFLAGRPPILDVDDDATRQRIVSFDSRTSGDYTETLFQEKHAGDIQPAARDLICRLLDRDQTQRPRMNQVADHDFFKGTDVFSLHRGEAYPLDVGTVAAQPDAQWSRRQFSSIWSPQPAAYDISAADKRNPGAGQSVNSGVQAIPEGDEGSAFFGFSKSGTAKSLLPPSVTAKPVLPRI